MTITCIPWLMVIDAVICFYFCVLLTSNCNSSRHSHIMENHVITLQRDDSNVVKVHLYGATVVSWMSDSKERLYLSPLSELQGSKAIRGGIPLVFPNFGPWDNRPQHGFARISWWKIAQDVTKTKDGDCKLVLSLADTTKTRKMWNFKFTLDYTIVVGKGCLSTQLDIKNNSETDFDFTALLHTYIKVSDIKNVTVSGFEGCLFDDKVKKETDIYERRAKVAINENVDRVYKDCGNQDGHDVCWPDGNISVSKYNLPDTVLWNPWAEKAASMSDFADDGYKHMVCVEPGFVANRKVLQPNEVFSCSQTLKIC